MYACRLLEGVALFGWGSWTAICAHTHLYLDANSNKNADKNTCMHSIKNGNNCMLMNVNGENVCQVSELFLNKFIESFCKFYMKL